MTKLIFTFDCTYLECINHLSLSFECGVILYFMINSGEMDMHLWDIHRQVIHLNVMLMGMAFKIQ